MDQRSSFRFVLRSLRDCGSIFSAKLRSNPLNSAAYARAIGSGHFCGRKLRSLGALVASPEAVDLTRSLNIKFPWSRGQYSLLFPSASAVSSVTLDISLRHNTPILKYGPPYGEHQVPYGGGDQRAYQWYVYLPS